MRKRWVEQNPCAIEIFLPEKWEGGGAGKAGHQAPLLQQQHVFIVMQISSCNLGHIQVHPVLVAGTETSTSSLLLTALSALLSHSHGPRACFATRLLYPRSGAVPWSTSATPGSREVTAPLSPSQVALWGGMCPGTHGRALMP